MKNRRRSITVLMMIVAFASLSLAATACSGDTAYATTEETEDAGTDETISVTTEETTDEGAEETTDAGYSDFASYLGEVKTFQKFTDDPVSEADIDTIVSAGVNAQSGMNRQKWHFSAVTSKEIQSEINSDADAPLVIVISCGDGTEYDAGLATQAMNSAALALGYGTKIISSPTSYLNGENQDYYRELLGIPDDMSVVGLLLVGTSEDPDALSGASKRNPYDEMTTYLP